MAQTDRRAWAAGEFVGKDLHFKNFERQAGNISASQFGDLVSTVQNLNLTVVASGTFSAGAQDNVNLVLEGADNLANGDIAGYVITNSTF